MRDDVRRSALEAAARLTVTVMALGGCTESKPPQTASSGSPSMTAPTASTAAIASTATPAPEVDCEAEVKAAFPTVGDYPGKDRGVSPVVSRCCEKLLLAHGSGLANRWDCCGNLPQ